MPEIFREGSFVVRVLLPPREHGPAHVHVWSPEGYMVVQLEPSLSIREAHGIKSSTAREILSSIEARYDECLAAWRRYHG